MIPIENLLHFPWSNREKYYLDNLFNFLLLSLVLSLSLGPSVSYVNFKNEML